jgi:L-ornithine Nalpha-acyltransferase
VRENVIEHRDLSPDIDTSDSERRVADGNACSPSHADAAPGLANLSARLATCPEEIRAAQQLRYQVFYEEGGAHADVFTAAQARDVDTFDDIAEHLIVIDQRRADAGINRGVVGNYRLLRDDARPRGRDFYTSGEFDIGVLLQTDLRLLELGRSCILREYRHRLVLQLLWTALARYVAEHRIDLLFGCASFPGTDPAAIADQLAYLHHHHLAPAHWQPHAIGPDAVAMDRLPAATIDAAQVFKRLEPLIRGYLRLGATIGRGAHLDRHFNTIDVCIVLPTAQLSSRYLRRFEREGRFAMTPPRDAGIAPDVGVAAPTRP